MSQRRVSPAIAALAVACLAVGAGCTRSRQPVASVSAPQTQLELPHGSMLSLELTWQPSQPLPSGTTPLVFMHLLDAQGNITRTFDHPFPGRWQVGSAVRDRVALYHSAIGPALSPGDYRLTVGLYDGKKERFDLEGAGGEVGKREYVIAQVKAPAVAPTAPTLTFSPEWSAPEPTGDRQSLARRWLSGDGTLEVAGVAAPARLWILLNIPKSDPGLRQVLDAGLPETTLPAVRVSANCGGGFSADVAGEGLHEVAVPIQAAGPCTVAFDTNFTVVEIATGRKLSVDLEQIGWETGNAAMPPTGP